MAAPGSPNFSVEPLEGIDFTQVYTINASSPTSAGYAPEVPAPPFPVGMHALGSNGSEYVFCKIAATIPKWAAVYIDSTFTAGIMDLTHCTQPGFAAGFAQAGPATFISSTISTYMWVAIRGENLGVLARLGSLANSKLYVSSVSPGTLSSTSVRALSALVAGAVLTTSSTGAGASNVTTMYAQWPRTVGM